MDNINVRSFIEYKAELECIINTMSTDTLDFISLLDLYKRGKEIVHVLEHILDSTEVSVQFIE